MTSRSWLGMLILPLISLILASSAQEQSPSQSQAPTGRWNIFRPSFGGLPQRYYWLSRDLNMGKRSLALGRQQFRPGKRNDEWTMVDPLQSSDFLPIEQQKRSLALGRSRFRPGKRADTSPAWLMLTDGMENAERSIRSGSDDWAPYGSHGFSLLTEAQMGKRSMVLGKAGFRPAKKSMAVGRLRFRPGKRSIATGRTGFRPGKRSPDTDFALDEGQS